MLVRHRTWRSSSNLAAALAGLGRRRTAAVAVPAVPLELAHAVAGEPGAGVRLGLTTPATGADKRLVVWERCESDGDRHTVYLRGDLVDGVPPAGPETSIVLRPRAPGHYRVVDDCNGHLLHHFHVGATTGPG